MKLQQPVCVVWGFKETCKAVVIKTESHFIFSQGCCGKQVDFYQYFFLWFSCFAAIVFISFTTDNAVLFDVIIKKKSLCCCVFLLYCYFFHYPKRPWCISVKVQYRYHLAFFATRTLIRIIIHFFFGSFSIR